MWYLVAILMGMAPCLCWDGNNVFVGMETMSLLGWKPCLCWDGNHVFVGMTPCLCWDGNYHAFVNRSSLPSQEYFKFQETRLASTVSTLSRKYHAISPLLIKVEGLVVHTNTGKSPWMKKYYAYWERKIFDSLVKVCTAYTFL